MSWFCIHEKTLAGTYYEPPESYCELGYEECSDICPYCASSTAYEEDRTEPDWF